MPCKKKEKLPTKCTPTSRRMLEGLTIKELAEAVAEHLPCTHTLHPIPRSGQYSNDPDDCNSGVYYNKCTSHHQEHNETLKTPSQSEACLSTCREVLAIYDEIQQCRHKIGALAKEAQQLVITASGILERCGCDKQVNSQQVNKRSYSEVKRIDSTNNYGKETFRGKSSEKLIPCVSCENAAKNRRKKIQEGYTAVCKQSNRNKYDQIRYRERKSKEEVIYSDAKLRRNVANCKKEKQTDIKNSQKICGKGYICDEATMQSGSGVNKCGFKKITSFKEKSSNQINGRNNSSVASRNVIEDQKKHDKNANRKSDKGTCCNCDVNDSVSEKDMKKQNKRLEKHRSKNIRQENHGKKTCNNTKGANSKLNVDDCTCFTKMKKRKKKLNPLERIWKLINEKETRCDCVPKKVDDCGCKKDTKKRGSNSCCVKRCRNKVCGNNFSCCNCSSKSVVTCECDKDMENRNTILNKKISRKNSSLQKIMKKTSHKNITSKCPSKSFDDCKGDEEMEHYDSICKKLARNNCILEKIRKKNCDKDTCYDCGLKNVDNCDFDDDDDEEEKQSTCSTEIRKEDCVNSNCI